MIVTCSLLELYVLDDRSEDPFGLRCSMSPGYIWDIRSYARDVGVMPKNTKGLDNM